MIESLKKASLLGIGLAALTQERLQELLKELEEKGEITREEGKALAKEALAEREKSAKELEKRITKQVEKTLEKMGIPTRKDLDKLGRRIAKLERTIKESAK
jgi:polyhydroxyalkanoate synthesis regulator phasin